MSHITCQLDELLHINALHTNNPDVIERQIQCLSIHGPKETDLPEAVLERVQSTASAQPQSPQSSDYESELSNENENESENSSELSSLSTPSVAPSEPSPRQIASIVPPTGVSELERVLLLTMPYFEGDYLPHDILYREKAAFSDAVGHSMVDYLKEYAQSLYTDEEYQRKRLAYTHAQPFTKESLLYREIFEKYYPGQSDMVVDFWMPNKAWKGCDVNDPSARVLSNYGASGK